MSLFFSSNGFTISVKEASIFFQRPVMISAKLSPDGKYVAAIKNNNVSQNLVLINTHSGEKKILLNLSEFTQLDSSLRAIVWLDNNSIAAQFSEIKKGVDGLTNTQNSSYLLIIKTPDFSKQKIEILSVRTTGWLVAALRDQPDVFLYAKSGVNSKIYKLNINQLSKHKQKINKLQKIDGGQFKKSNEVASINGYAIKWFFGAGERPTSALKYRQNGNLALVTLNKKENHKIPHIKTIDNKSNALQIWSSDILQGNTKINGNKKSSLIIPVALADEKNTFYCLDFFEEEERSVYKINYETGAKNLIFEADSFKIIDLILTDPENKLIGVQVLKDGGLHNIYLDGNGHKKNLPSVKKTEPNLKLLIGQSKDKETQLYYVESHSQPGQYLIKNSRTSKQKVIGSLYPHLDKNLNSYLIEDSIVLNDIEIPYLLTLPKNKAVTSFPLIVMPHGGPIGIFDHRYFDLLTQYLATNGYAVLRVNFRGSSGQTKALKEAGKKQWGNKMLSDIHLATLKVSTLKEIDQRKICIFGISYGGYAAAMLTILHPKTYRCAVDVAGVSDLNLYLNAPNRSHLQEKWILEQIGDPVTEYDALKIISPAYLTNKLERPILIMHGTKDEVVDIEHAYRMKLMLEKHKKTFEWQIFSEEKHGFTKIESTVKLFSKAIKFIDDKLK